MNAKPQASSEQASGKATVVNTDGQGANMRGEPSATGPLVRTIKEGTELEVIGEEQESGGRKWRNVRDPSDGNSGWIVSELLSPVTPVPAAPAAASSPPPASKPAGEPKPAAEAKPAGQPKPSGGPNPTGSPPPASAPAGAAKPSQRIGDADRAYLGVLQEQVDTLGKSITAANEQIERAGGRPDILSDPAWRQDTQNVAKSLRDAAAKIRVAQPGPATGGVQKFANNAADRADEAANQLTAALDSQDARNLTDVRTTLVRMLAEINNMNLTLLELQ
ncbi:MAG: SH3 domain-containing protein [Chloroflexota bacterium]